MPLLVGGYGWPPVGVLETTDFGKLAEKVLSDAIGRAVGSGAPARIAEVVKDGDAARVLIEAAAGASRSWWAARGYGGFAEALLGSVSQHCVHHARRPVVIIRGARALSEPA
jgi:Universal stress protein family